MCISKKYSTFAAKYFKHMDILLIILGALCLLVGLVGCVVPVLPGVPLAYVGLLLLHWTEQVQFTWQFLVIWAVITIVIQVLDFIIPAWGTKKFGGTKWGVTGSTLGLLVGLFMGPFGIIAGPFVGAVVGAVVGRVVGTVVAPISFLLPQATRPQQTMATATKVMILFIIPPKNFDPHIV